MRIRTTTPSTMKATKALAALGLGLAALVAWPAPRAAAQQATTLRIATQAPEGTVWMDAMNDVKAEVERGSRGRVRFQVFPNGSQGDEKAVIERMQVGLLHGGLFTGIGLGEILPMVRILELPFVYEDKAEIDAVRVALEPDFKRGFEEKGFVFLGWSEVGWAYVFSKQEARNLAELRQRKIWVWQGDPLAEKVFQTFELAGTPLPLTDVLTSLQTGMIDSVYNAPYGLVGLQWHHNVKFMSRMTVGHGTGALLVSKAEWQKLPPAVRNGIGAAARKRLDALLVEVAQKNEETIAQLQKDGVQIVPIPQDEMPRYRELGAKVADEMVGKLYDKATLDRVKAILAERRAKR